MGGAGAVDAGKITADLDHVAYLQGAVTVLTALAEGCSETNPRETVIMDTSYETVSVLVAPRRDMIGLHHFVNDRNLGRGPTL